jgi:hypothetical protein
MNIVYFLSHFVRLSAVVHPFGWNIVLISLILLRTMSRIVNYEPDTDNDAQDYYEEYIAKVKYNTEVELEPGHG